MLTCTHKVHLFSPLSMAQMMREGLEAKQRAKRVQEGSNPDVSADEVDFSCELARRSS